MEPTHWQEDFSATECARTTMLGNHSPSDIAAAIALVLLSSGHPVRSSVAPATRTPLPSSRPIRPSVAPAARTPLPSSRPIPPSATIISNDQNSSRSASADDETSVRSSSPPLFTFVVSRAYGVPATPAAPTDFPALTAAAITLAKPGYGFYCAEHKKDIRNQSGWTRHLKEKHGLEFDFKCDNCENTFSSEFLRKRHDNLIHKLLRLYECNACEITYQEKKDLVKHNDKHHPSP